MNKSTTPFDKYAESDNDKKNNKGSNKSSTPCGKYARSDNGIKYHFVFIRDGDGDDDDDDDDNDDGDDDDCDDDDHVHGSYIHLHIESPPTWHFINKQPFRDSATSGLHRSCFNQS